MFLVQVPEERQSGEKERRGREGCMEGEREKKEMR